MRQEEWKMWTCPKCGRTFKKREQDHYCGKAPETVEEYIAMQPEGIRQYLKEVRNGWVDGSHGVCRLIGRGIILSILPVLKTMWACIRGRKLSGSLLNV